MMVEFSLSTFSPVHFCLKYSAFLLLHAYILDYIFIRIDLLIIIECPLLSLVILFLLLSTFPDNRYVLHSQKPAAVGQVASLLAMALSLVPEALHSCYLGADRSLKGKSAVEGQAHLNPCLSIIRPFWVVAALAFLRPSHRYVGAALCRFSSCSRWEGWSSTIYFTTIRSRKSWSFFLKNIFAGYSILG